MKFSINNNIMKVVINGKFHFTNDERDNFDETYAHDFGITISEMKMKYKLKNKLVI